MPRKTDSNEQDYWSRGGQIFFHQGKAYATAVEPKAQGDGVRLAYPVIIGTENEVLDALYHKKSLGNSFADNVITLDRSKW